MATLYYFIESARNPEEQCAICKKNGEKVYSGRIKDIPENLLIDTYVLEWSTASGIMEIFIVGGKSSIINE